MVSVGRTHEGIPRGSCEPKIYICNHAIMHLPQYLDMFLSKQKERKSPKYNQYLIMICITFSPLHQKFEDFSLFRCALMKSRIWLPLLTRMEMVRSQKQESDYVICVVVGNPLPTKERYHPSADERCHSRFRCQTHLLSQSVTSIKYLSIYTWSFSFWPGCLNYSLKI